MLPDSKKAKTREEIHLLKNNTALRIAESDVVEPGVDSVELQIRCSKKYCGKNIVLC